MVKISFYNIQDKLMVELYFFFILDPFNDYNTARSVRENNLKTLRKILAEESKKMPDYKGTRKETKEI